MKKYKARILLTGGAGYIGAHMVYKLLEAGYNPIVVDNLSSGFQHCALPVPCHIFDISNNHKWDLFFSENQVDLVMHFAASTQVSESIRNPEKYYCNNFFNTMILLNQMRKRHIHHFIFSSSAAIFGEPHYIPVDEKHPKNPINPYGKSKLMCEMLLSDYELCSDIRSVCLRYFNAAGADPLSRVGFNVRHHSQVVPVLLSVACGLKNQFSIFGTDYDTKDGTCVRDYIHIDDICNAHLLAAEYLLSGGKSDVFNLGNGRGYSVLELVHAAEKVTKQPIALLEQKRRAGDPSCVISNSSKIELALGWKPFYPDLEVIMAHAWQWMMKSLQSVAEKNHFIHNR